MAPGLTLMGSYHRSGKYLINVLCCSSQMWMMSLWDRSRFLRGPIPVQTPQVQGGTPGISVFKALPEGQ